MDKNAVGNRITELCNENNITINRLAVLSQIPPSTLKNVVYGQVGNPGIDTISKICDGLGISIKSFFDCKLFEKEKVNETQN